VIPELIEVGFVRKPKGFQGLLKIATHEQYEDALLNSSYLFVDMDGSKVPYAVEKVELAKDVVVRLEDILTSEDAMPLVGKDIFVEATLLNEHDKSLQANDNLTYGKVVGFTMIDRGVEAIGVVENVEQYPGQEMAIVQVPSGETVLVPLVEEFIVEIDEEGKRILVRLPEGLLTT